MSFIRYNETAKYWEKDTSVAQNGSGPWIILPIDYTQIYNPPSTGYVNHADKHNTGGTDPITALSGGVITTGTVVDARLSSNVPLKNANNDFTAAQIISHATIPSLYFNETAQPANSRQFRILGNSQKLYFQAMLDGINNVPPTGGVANLDRSGNFLTTGTITERGRTVPMGEWQDVPFNAANFASAAGMAWTVNAAAVIVNRYTLIGKTMIWALQIDHGANSVLSGTSHYQLFITVPGGYTARMNTHNSVAYCYNGSAGNYKFESFVTTSPSAGYVTVMHLLQPGTLGYYSLDIFGLRFVITFEIN